MSQPMSFEKINSKLTVLVRQPAQETAPWFVDAEVIDLLLDGVGWLGEDCSKAGLFHFMRGVWRTSS